LCGKSKGLVRHSEIWWWNKNVNHITSKKKGYGSRVVARRNT